MHLLGTPRYFILCPVGSAGVPNQTARRRPLAALFAVLDVKYGLFEPAKMRITKNRVSRGFYDPEDLRVFLEGLQNQTQSMDTASSIRSQDPPGLLLSVALSTLAPEDMGRTTAGSYPRRRDLERLTKSHDNRGQVLQAVAMHTQIADRDKSLSPLKNTLTPTRGQGNIVFQG
ncbi:hypothetical protein NDU88_009995 [Pleurodeles waltl]|uniref:DivIVA domain-containing protein n=1 Tax=Pleurodeles waltl TaxID=8319 RepID=A0AAV7QZ48_PLEWA|nr:hypothetical protein NDU88_009995 [Pleurodeles waltl]